MSSVDVVVGIDLAGSERRPSGFCVMRNLMASTKILFKDREILEEVWKANPSVIAIDAPLSFPKGKISSHMRECDKQLVRMGIRIFPPMLGPMRMLTTRGVNLREKLERKGFRVIEVYPGGAQDVLGIPRKRGGKDRLLAGLVRLGIRGIARTATHHELDAATSAYVAFLYLRGEYEEYGDPEEGVIIMPKLTSPGRFRVTETS